MQKEEERLLDNKYDFGDLEANTIVNNKVNDEKAKPLINLNSFPTESSTKKTSNKYQKLKSAGGIDINSPITIKTDEVQKGSKNMVGTPSGQKLLQKKRTNRSLENKNINGKIKANNKNTKKDLVGTKKNDNNQIKKKNQEKEKGKGLKIVNEKVINTINTINNNINNIGNNDMNNTNNSIIKNGNNNDNNISIINPIKIEINEKNLLYRTEEYKNNTRYFDPSEDGKNLKRLYDFCLSDDENCDIYYYSYLKDLFKQYKK